MWKEVALILIVFVRNVVVDDFFVREGLYLAGMAWFSGSSMFVAGCSLRVFSSPKCKFVAGVVRRAFSF